MSRHIVIVVPRGEAVRNFLLSDVLGLLTAESRVTVLSVVQDPWVVEVVTASGAEFVPLEDQGLDPRVGRIVETSDFAHFRMIWSEVAREMWLSRDETEHGIGRVKWTGKKMTSRALAGPRRLALLDRIDRAAAWRWRTSDEPLDLLTRLKPDLVFNGSHIHGPAGTLPILTANRLGIRTAGFIFSWDNLTSRARLHQPYDDVLVWNDQMARQFLATYPGFAAERVHVVGTPQFDFHHDERFTVDRAELCGWLGIDPTVPYVLYTAGIARHFPDEHRTVALVAEEVERLGRRTPLQLVVRVNVKETTAEMRRLRSDGLPGTTFQEVHWDPGSFTPTTRDLYEYTNLVRHAAVGINAASTVSLELMLHDHPVINLGFDPPGSALPRRLAWERHFRFDHYRQVIDSGAVMAARSPADVRWMLESAIDEPALQHGARQAFIDGFLGPFAHEPSAPAVAETLLGFAARR